MATCSSGTEFRSMEDAPSFIKERGGWVEERSDIKDTPPTGTTEDKV